MNYEELRRLFRLEKNTSKLAKVDKEFFDKLKTFVESEREEYLSYLKEGTFSKAKDFNNLKKLVEELLSLREKKLLNAALISSRSNDLQNANLCSDEEKTFKKILEILQEHKNGYDYLFDSNKKTVKKTKQKDLNKISLRIIKEVPSFVGADMKEYGPFLKEQETDLPIKTAELLIERKLAEKK